ncbi:MAG: diguanylate cyclase [Stappiaceae bacterium]
MAQKEDFQRTIAYGESAMSYLRRNELPAFPRNYELWYTYSAGFNHALNKTINEILAEKGTVSEEEIANLYTKYLSANRLGERIEQVGDDISNEIEHIMQFIDDSQGASKSYGNSLMGAQSALKNVANAEQLRSIIKHLVTETRDSVAANNKLQDQLQESRNQIATLHETLEAIRYESLTDELTTLANRKHFEQAIERSIEQAQESKTSLSLLLTDIDHFKKFNDNFGHQTGDQVLRLVALAVKQNIKGQDTACRYGGEEFAVILPHTTMQQATSVAEHIRKAVISKELVKRSTGENLGRITISIGVSTFHSGDTPQAMIARSDAALYAAKHSGRNAVKCEDDPSIKLDGAVA